LYESRHSRRFTVPNPVHYALAQLGRVGSRHACSRQEDVCVRLTRFPSSLTVVSDTRRLASPVTFGTAAGGAHGAGENVIRKQLHADDTLPSDKLSLGGG
jgi:hypothetical protein